MKETSESWNEPSFWLNAAISALSLCVQRMVAAIETMMIGKHIKAVLSDYGFDRFLK